MLKCMKVKQLSEKKYQVIKLKNDIFKIYFYYEIINLAKTFKSSSLGEMPGYIP